MNFTIKWTYGEPREDRKDAVWFYGENCIATATLTQGEKNYSLDIYCDGETLLRVPYLNEDGTPDESNLQYLRYENEFESAGIHNDADLEAISKKFENFDIWVHNSWFDLYVEGEHLDAVTHEIPDAVAQAQAVLEEVASVGGWEAYWKTLTP